MGYRPRQARYVIYGYGLVTVFSNESSTFPGPDVGNSSGVHHELVHTDPPYDRKAFSPDKDRTFV